MEACFFQRIILMRSMFVFIVFVNGLSVVSNSIDPNVYACNGIYSVKLSTFKCNDNNNNQAFIKKINKNFMGIGGQFKA